MATWHRQLGKDKLEILLFPTDDFNQDNPSTDSAFVRRYGLPSDGGGCTLMSKTKVKGPEAHSVFQFAKTAYPGEIGWNFDGAYLFDGKGAPRGKFSLRSPPNVQAMEEALKTMASEL